MKSRLPIIALLIVTALSMCPFLSQPWVYRDDYASAAFATVARNHARLGLATTKGASILALDRRDPAASPVYAHHPFLYPLVVGATFRVCGISEAVARGVAIVVALASIYLLYRLVRAEFDELTGWLAAALFALSPANLFEGRVVSLEQPAVLWITASVCAYRAWLRSRTRLAYVRVLAVLAVGMLTEWQVYYLAAILPLHHALVYGARGHWRRLANVELLAPAMFALFVGHVWLADPRQIADLWQAFLFRAGMLSGAEQVAFAGHTAEYSFVEFVGALARHLDSLMLAPLLGLAAAGLIVAARRLWRERAGADRYSIPYLLLAPAVAHTLLFSNATYVHECLVILYLPGLAAAAAIPLAWLAGGPRWSHWRCVLAAALLVVQLTGSIRRVSDLYSEVATGGRDGLGFGREIANATRPEDTVLVLGMPYHPAAEWYADRDLRFADDPAIGRGARAAEPEAVAIGIGVKEFVELSGQLDPAGTRFREDTAKLLAITQRDFTPQHETPHLTIYRRRADAKPRPTGRPIDSEPQP